MGHRVLSIGMGGIAAHKIAMALARAVITSCYENGKLPFRFYEGQIMSKSSVSISQSILESELRSRKVAVWSSSEGHWKPIPVSYSPTIVSKEDWSQLAADARLILGVFPRVLAWIVQKATSDDPGIVLLGKMFGGLSNFESEFISLEPDQQWGHVTIRMDLYWHRGEIKIIEVNCTIPAMQAYSRNVYNSWRAAGGQPGSAQSPDNVSELLQSIVHRYRLDGGMLSRPRIAILHRAGDSQIGELIWFEKTWTELGYQTIRVTPDQLARVGDVWLAHNQPCDIVYRHIFASKLAETSFADCLKKNKQHHIYNPVSAHYESKGFLALVSHIAADEDLARQVGFSSNEVLAIEQRVPWTRVMGGSFGSVSTENLERRLEGIVLKRSVGYGGHHVLMGDSWFSNETQHKLQTLTGNPGIIDFATFASWCQTDDSLWIVQERMSGARRRTDVLTPTGVESWDAWYDASIFLNTGDQPVCLGGVSRIAKSPVVNIGTGGGLAPFLIDS